MSYWVVYSEQTGSLASMTSYQGIQDLFNRSRLAQLSGGGSWVSRVRVTRTGGLSSLGGGRTTAAAIYEFPNAYNQNALETALRNLHGSVDGMLNADTSAGHGQWGNVVITPFNPSVNGPISWWQCANMNDCASNTSTKDQSPALQNAPYENPVGPTVPGVTSVDPSHAVSFTPLYFGLAVLGVIALAPTINTVVRSIVDRKEQKTEIPAAPVAPEVPAATTVAANPRRRRAKR